MKQQKTIGVNIEKEASNIHDDLWGLAHELRPLIDQAIYLLKEVEKHRSDFVTSDFLSAAPLRRSVKFLVIGATGFLNYARNARGRAYKKEIDKTKEGINNNN